MILIFGGTSDSLNIAAALEAAGYNYLLSVATTYGKLLAAKKVNELSTADRVKLGSVDGSHSSKNYQDSQDCPDSQDYQDSIDYKKSKNTADSKILEGRLDQKAMKQLIIDKQIKLILDATHPYAIEVSKNAMTVAQEMGLSYIRYERPSLLEAVQGEYVHIVKDIEEACEVANTLGQNVFLGTGSKTLGAFVAGLKDKKIIARVLPTSEVIKECEALGLSPENIVGMKGPFSEEINVALYKHYKIDCMITKESGVEGGFLEKVEGCIRQGIHVIVIKREQLDYPKVASSIDVLLETLSSTLQEI